MVKNAHHVFPLLSIARGNNAMIINSCITGHNGAVHSELFKTKTFLGESKQSVIELFLV